MDSRSSSSSVTAASERIDYDAQQAQRVQNLARQISRQSAHSTHIQNLPHRHPSPILDTDEDLPNPFLGSDDPRLVPSSGKFDYRVWLDTLLHIQSRDPERYPRRTAGISFRDLSVHGFGSASDYQKSFGNGPLVLVDWMKKLFGLESKRKIQILSGFDGLVKSGEMLVVLGRPGSGCSTFLKTIAGETYGFNVSEESHINYQGISAKKMHNNFRGEVIYQAETEAHFPHLTVGETLSFAARARAPRNRMQGVTREQYADHMRDVVMTILGLWHTVNTRVGNDFIRGISGGERKRVSIAEVTLSGSPLQCWDNSTRGLDSATAVEFVRTLKTSAEITGSTALVAIYQAPQSAYDLFDKVTVLYEGRQIYFGSTHSAKQYFIDLGYECPPRQTTADFLTSVTSPTERIVRSGFEFKAPRTPTEFVAAWKASEEYKRLLADIDEYDQRYPVDGPQLDAFRNSRQAQQAKGVSSKSPYTISFPMQVQLCMGRGFLRQKSEVEVLIVSVIGNSILALIISSIFYNLPETTSSFFRRGALIFFTILINAFASILEVLALYEQRPIVQKHDNYALYRPAAEAMAAIIVGLPAKIATAIPVNLVVYFMSNLRRESGPFFIFFLFSFFTTLVMSNIFRTLGASTKTLAQALPPVSFFMLALVIYTGFAVPIRDMKPWFRWMNYIDPIAYAFESLMVNEFADREFECDAFIPAGLNYEPGSSNTICSTVGSVPGQTTVSGTTYIQQTFDYVPSHLWRNFGILVAFFFFFLATYLFASEYILAAKSKGEVLVFRRGHEPKGRSSDDPEAGALEGLDKVAHRDVRNEKVAGIQRQSDIFMWRDVCYDIKIKGEPRRLLDHVDGWVKPGTLTALMGVSGAGKTTLLDVLASRVTMGVVSGDMLVNGHQRDPSFQRKTGYVQQQDLHLETTTVREALVFSALLRQPAETSEKEKLDYVEEVIKLLEMGDYAEAIVGVPGEGLNVEQRKRLTIGVELVAKPQLLLFLDEPTSGLDSQTSWSIATLMRKLANNGQAILCTIHQPSAILFQEFDRLLFLARGGKTVYFGPIGTNSSILINYFESHGSQPCPPDANPAEWMLEVIGAAPGAVSNQDWPEVWRNSTERLEVRNEIASMAHTLSAKQPSGASGDSSKAFATSFWTQYRLVFARVWSQYWRTPSYTYSKVIVSTLTALFVGFSLYKAQATQQGLQNQMFGVFMFLTIFSTLLEQQLPYFVKQRALYEVRERPSKAYSWQSFLAANITVELPWSIFMAVLAFFSVYYTIGLQRHATWTDAVAERGGLFFLLVVAFYVHCSTFANMIIAGLETADTAANIASLMFSMCFIFCGVLATEETMPTFWIFMYRVSPFTYLVQGLLSAGLASAPLTCSDIELKTFDPPAGLACGEYLTEFLNMTGASLANPTAISDCQVCQLSNTNTFLDSINARYSEAWRNLGILFAFIVINIIAAFFFYWLGRVPKGNRMQEQPKSTQLAQEVKVEEKPE